MSDNKSNEINENKDAMNQSYDPVSRPDRLGEYVRYRTEDFLFGEFSDDFIEKAGLPSDFKGVPIPIKKAELQDLSGEKGMAPDEVAENMVLVMGCDPHFPYVDEYKRYIQYTFTNEIIPAILNVAAQATEKEDHDEAFLHARGALVLAPANRDAIFAYALTVQNMYLGSEDPEFVGRCKAESIEYFEYCTVKYPEFAPAFYYLGYAYLNMGLYIKAQITWQTYLMLANEQMEGLTSAEEEGQGTDEKARENELNELKEGIKDIKERIGQLADPVEIEQGCNEASAGRFEIAIEILEPFLGRNYDEWWPLHYYIALSYEAVGRKAEAKDEYKKALRLNPAHLESMEGMKRICKDEGDREGYEKYSQKIEIVRSGLEEDEASKLN